MKSIPGISSRPFVFVCLLFISLTTVGQDLDDITIYGTVTDSNGAIIVGARVTATSVGTGRSISTVTDGGGRYSFIELPPGRYRVKAASRGFGTQESRPNEKFSGQNLQLSFTLFPASVTAEQTIVVSEEVPTKIDVSRIVVGSTVAGIEIEELPNPTNDVLALVFMVAGTAEEPLSIRNLASDDRIGEGNKGDQPAGVIGSGSISLSGGAAYSTNITIDGLDNNDDRTADERFQPPIDSVAEIQIVSSQFSAEYGRASGGRVNIRTKSGGRSFKGRLVALFQDDGLNANTYNNKRRGLSRLPYTVWEPGGTLSGPIPIGYFKNRTHFFSAYSFRNRDATTRIFSAVPVLPNPRYPLPAPTNPDSARSDLAEPGSAQIASYIAQVNTPQRRHRFTQRVDHAFTDSHNITFNYQIGRSEGFRQYRETTRFLEDTLQGKIRKNDSFYVTDNYVVNSGFVNQFRFQYGRHRPDFRTGNPEDPVILLRVRDETLIGDEDRINGTVVIGNSTSNFANVREEIRYQVQETANLVFGPNHLRIGADIQSIDSTTVELRDSTGTYSFDNADGFLRNEIVRFRRNSNAESTLKNTYYGVFVQNEWRPLPNTTVSFGLRYERESLLRDKNNFGPRAGIAFSPGDGGRSVIRFGGGIFYNRTLLRTIDDFVIDQTQQRFDSNRLTGTTDEGRCFTDPVFAAGKDECVFLKFVSAGFPDPPTIEQIRSIPGVRDIGRGFTQDVFTRRLEDNIKIPESYQFNVGYERDFGAGFTAEANFTYNKTVRLWREQNINAHRVPQGFSNFADYLVSLGEIEIPGTTSGTDIYRFEFGNSADTNGDRDSESGADCRSNTPLCIVNLNTLNGSTATLEPIGIAKRVLNAMLDRPISNEFSQIEQVGSMGKSVYEGLQITVRKGFGELGFGFGASMRFSYVLSRTRDDGFVDTSSAQTQGDFASEFSRSLTDRRHRIRFSGTAQLPAWLGKLMLSPNIRVESGRPFNISIGGSDRNLDDVGTDRPNYSGDIRDIVWRHPNDSFDQSLVDRFSLQPIGGSGGNLGRNSGRGPGLFIFDLNLSRQFNISDRIRLRPRISFDNVLNATVFSFGSDFINLSTAGTPEFEQGFLTPSRTLRQRKIQIGMRVDF